jgi:hypothetical protein
VVISAVGYDSHASYLERKQARASLGSFDEMASGLLVRAGRKSE